MMHKILVVDDDVSIVEMITYSLRQGGYQVLTADSGSSGLKLAIEERPNLVILDLMMPEMNGLEVCSHLRQEKKTSTIPIIMLTAKKEEVDKVIGLEIGADDYIIKPFGYRELLARVRALLRRSSALSPQEDAEQKKKYLIAGPVRIALKERRVTCRGTEVLLSPRQFDLLEYLIRNYGIVLTRDQLLQDIWGYDYAGGTRTVDVHIRWLREKLEQDPTHPQLIHTKLKVGYLFRWDQTAEGVKTDA